MTSKRIQVVMLPTYKKAKEGELYFLDKLIISDGKYTGEISQHLYFLSDEEIKKGDFYICMSSMYPKECVKRDSGNGCVWVEDYLGNQDQLKFCKKITATSDESLSLPKPSLDFLKVFTEEYNKGNTIELVNIEYEEINTVINYSFPISAKQNYKPKINSKNEITIRKIKDS